MNETIAAIATPPGVGALAVLRVSGPGAAGVLGRLLRLGEAKVRALLPARRVVLRRLWSAQGVVIDEVLLTRFEAPASFTGEEVIEIFGHGGVLVTRALLEALLQAGARAALPGEFSRRAFENGKLDLTQAEAIMDLIGARSELARRAAQAQLGGELGARVERLRGLWLNLLAHVEAWIDFPDEDIDPAGVAELRARMDSLAGELRRLLATGHQGRLLREGARVVLSGRPNAGKSSVLNKLTGFDRAIVSATPGTTRDTVEEWLDLGGVPVHLVDTAGLRADGADEVESEGMRRSRAEWELADLVVEIVDGSVAGEPDAELARARERLGFRHLLLLNKRDLGLDPAWAERGGLAFSALSDEAEVLAGAIGAELAAAGSLVEGEVIAINARHQAELTRALEHLLAAEGALGAGLEPEFVALDLREGLAALGEIVGKVDVEELLGEIFASFCIGK